jgi:hypothetical protein
MGLPGAASAPGLALRVDAQSDARDFLPVGARRLGVEQARIRDRVPLVVGGEDGCCWSESSTAGSRGGDGMIDSCLGEDHWEARLSQSSRAVLRPRKIDGALKMRAPSQRTLAVNPSIWSCACCSLTHCAIKCVPCLDYVDTRHRTHFWPTAMYVPLPNRI